MSENKLCVADKDLQAIGLKLVEFAPTAETVDVYVYANTVWLRASFKDGTSRTADVPLLKEVDG